MSSHADTKILVINPIHTLREDICEQLQHDGFTNITDVSDGLHAIELLGENSYDLVVTDIEIHNLDAWRLTRLIRSDMLASPANTTVIVVSSTYSERIAEATSKEFEINRFIPLSNLYQLGDIAKDLMNESNARVPKARILVIEDYQDTAELVERVLSKRFDITHVADGETGLQTWLEGRHEIVLLDLMLPKMSGEAVLHEIIRHNPNQSVVMMTAHGDAKKAGELIIAGAVDFISKPFRAEQLRHVCSIAAHREDFIISNEQFKEKQNALTAEKSRAQITLESIADGVITTNALGDIDYINPVAQKILNCTLDEVRDQSIKDIFHTYHEISRIPTANLVKRAIAENSILYSAAKNVLKTKDNTERLIEQQAAPIRDVMGKAIGAILIFRDRTEAKRIEKQLSFHASHDPLTGLHNREIFDQEVRLAIHEVEGSDSQHALCHLSLSQFNMINETCGHRAGDKLLQQVAAVLQQKVRAPSDAIARIGGDEFGILLRHCPMDAAQRICEVIAGEFTDHKFEHHDKSFDINVGIGIVSITNETDKLAELISAASAACNKAKERGKNRVASYSGQDEELYEKRTEVLLATELMDAIKSNRTCLFQQRIMNGTEGGKDSFEILLRIQDEDGNLLAPGPHLNAAERYNLTPNVDRWVVKETLQWLSENPNVIDQIEYMSVNLSGLSICEDSFTDFITGCFKDSNVSPDKICFEITETAAVSNFIRAGEFISAMKDLGCKFALDDFGSGMSSFAYLKKLPVDILKIDGLFIKDILHDPIDMAMVKSINEVGHVMGLKTIAEYVENQSILEVLRVLEVDSFQGYEIAKPAPIDDLSEIHKAKKIS
ncbi:MAG: EAL domain-containing protein [Cellvibrionales bacterium]|nr:EAL domain-containing protein [Cellvibrionales bacterium]